MKNLEILNRKVNHDYFIIDTLECGIELKGNEVKSIKNGNCNISDAFCQIYNNQLTIVNMYIAKWETSNLYDILGERRERRLLAHKNEIVKFNNKVAIDGYTIIPIKIYTVNGKIKILIGLCKGKHNYDKRQSLKEKVIKRDIDRTLKTL